jgi:hypothetical protein
MRFAMGLTVVGAVLLIAGLSMVLVSEALRLKSGHADSGLMRAGWFAACAGLAIGVALVVALTSRKPDRGGADRVPADRTGLDRGQGIKRRQAAGTGLHSAEEWLSPLRPAGGSLAPQAVAPTRHEPAQQMPPASDDYADDGWSLDPEGGWSAGPAYGWAPGEQDDWDGQQDGDWDPGAGDWNPSADRTSWSPDGPHVHAPLQGYVTGPHGYPDAPGYLTGPQPAHPAGPLSSPTPTQAQMPVESEVVPAPKPFSVWEPAPKPSHTNDYDDRSDGSYRPAHAEPPTADTQEKIEQIKDLYLTAEAIGEDALGRHFEELHQRQRSLIREFFEKAGLGQNDTPTLLGDDSAQDGAPLPG